MEELLRLSATERADAARELLQSLDGADVADEVDAAWRDEIATRVAEIEDGSVQLEDGKTVMRRLREHSSRRSTGRHRITLLERDRRFELPTFSLGN